MCWWLNLFSGPSCLWSLLPVGGRRRLPLAEVYWVWFPGSSLHCPIAPGRTPRRERQACPPPSYGEMWWWWNRFRTQISYEEFTICWRKMGVPLAEMYWMWFPGSSLHCPIAPGRTPRRKRQARPPIRAHWIWVYENYGKQIEMYQADPWD